jgi:hypothetical protein
MKRALVLLLAVPAFAAGASAAAGTSQLPFANAVHAVGTITYANGGQKTWSWDRGRIAALSDTSITLFRRDGKRVTFAITPLTLLRNTGATYRLDDLMKAGLTATVVSQDGNALIIRNLRGAGAPFGADQSVIEGPAKASVTGSIAALDAGGASETFQYDRGRVTALSGGSVTIVRQDKQSLTFSYDPRVPVWAGGRLEDASALHVGQGGLFFSQDGKLAVVHSLALPVKAKPPSGPAARG